MGPPGLGTVGDGFQGEVGGDGEGSCSFTMSREWACRFSFNQGGNERQLGSVEITQLNKDPEPGGVCSSLPLGQVSAAGLYISFLLGLTFQLSLTPLRPDPRPSTSLSPPSPGESGAPDSPRPSFPGLCYGVSRESDETNEMAALHPLCLLTQGRKLGAPGALRRRAPHPRPSAVPESLGKAWRPPADRHNSSAPIHQGPPLRAWVTSVWRPGLGPPGAGWREWDAGGQGRAPTIPFWTASPGGPGIQQQPREGRPGAQNRRAPAPSLPAACGWARLGKWEPLLRFPPGLVSSDLPQRQRSVHICFSIGRPRSGLVSRAQRWPGRHGQHQNTISDLLHHWLTSSENKRRRQ